MGVMPVPQSMQLVKVGEDDELYIAPPEGGKLALKVQLASAGEEDEELWIPPPLDPELPMKRQLVNVGEDELL